MAHNAFGARRYLLFSLSLLLAHVFLMTFRYGQLPIAPVVPDEIIVNDASISLALGHGYAAGSLGDSKYGLDRIYTHYPPLYPYTQALAFRLFGVSVYSLRLTTTVMDIGGAIVFCMLLYRLCLRGRLAWDTALLVTAIYCTNINFAALERTARMESMIGLLTLLSFGSMLCAATAEPGEGAWLWPLLSALFGALTMAVHPEAVSSVLLIGIFLFFLVPARLPFRFGIAGLFVLVPVAVSAAVYRGKFFLAIRQLVQIARDSNNYNPGSLQWFTGLLRIDSVSALNQYLFQISILLLLVAGVVVGVITWFVSRRDEPDNFRATFTRCFSAFAVLELLLMFTAFRMNIYRSQPLFGVLLVCNSVCLFGGSSLNRWQRIVGTGVLLFQCMGAAYYLSPRKDRVADMNPERFLPVIAHVPRSARVAATPSFWLGFSQVGRPVDVLVYGLDGELEWAREDTNPLKRFDVVMLEQQYILNKPWLTTEAEEGRTLHSYQVGNQNIAVYVREGMEMIP